MSEDSPYLYNGVRISDVEHSIDGRGQFENTHLMSACMAGSITAVTFLLEHGADPNLKNEFGMTALMLSCHEKDIPICRLLLDAGADISIKDSWGMKIIHSAIRSIALLEFFIREGCDIEAKDSRGNTPLVLAFLIQYYDVIPFLVENGADITAKNNWGEDFRSLAVRIESPEIRDRILSLID